jgi:hypothetical protein
MFDHMVKKCSESCFKEYPEPVSICGQGFICEQGPKQLRLDFDRLSINPPEHSGIETQFIAKVAKDQGFVIA